MSLKERIKKLERVLATQAGPSADGTELAELVAIDPQAFHLADSLFARLDRLGITAPANPTPADRDAFLAQILADVDAARLIQNLARRLAELQPRRIPR